MPNFRKKPVTVTAHRWFKNGDHPDDGPADREGKVVRYFRRPEPEYEGTTAHDLCGEIWDDHGWIDTLEGGHTVCPGDWVITGVRGERYPCKPEIFAATYEPSGTDQPVRAALIEIVEKDHSTDDTPGVIVPNQIRINGTPLLIPDGQQIKVHSITLNENERGGTYGEDAACVTLTLFARRVTIAAEGDL